MSDAVLRVSGLNAGYGQTRVLEHIDLELQRGEAVSVIGRNGVGKSTLLATLMGHTTLHSGSVTFNGADISRMPVYRRVASGIGYVPQEREIFPSLTVRENLHIAARPGGWTEEGVFTLFPNIRERLGNAGNQLSGGEQQMLSIARALMSNPILLLMDEPTEGLAPVIVEQLSDVIVAAPPRRRPVDRPGGTEQPGRPRFFRADHRPRPRPYCLRRRLRPPARQSRRAGTADRGQRLSGNLSLRRSAIGRR